MVKKCFKNVSCNWTKYVLNTFDKTMKTFRQSFKKVLERFYNVNIPDMKRIINILMMSLTQLLNLSFNVPEHDETFAERL